LQPSLELFLSFLGTPHTRERTILAQGNPFAICHIESFHTTSIENEVTQFSESYK
jgi:hypothetical protein